MLEPFNLAANLVYSARGDEVRKVMIDGKIVYEDGELKTLDEAAVLAEIRDTVPARRRRSQLLG
jgi:5-methylthioadenosine/S-adenosylhomocysteine deaminase